MPKRVNLPDGRVINFPDTMSPEDIQAALSGMQSPAGTEAEQGGGGKLAALLGIGVAGAGALALRNPQMAKTAASKAFELLQGARHLGALSGAAVPKSVVGNVGAPFVAAAERGSLEPIKQFFKPQTVKDWLGAMKDSKLGRVADEVPGEAPMRVWNPFGRVMSAGDKATRGALGRAGLTDKEAARYTLQSSLPELGVTGKLAEVLGSKAGQYAVMYRRTPMNQAVHGADNIINRKALSAAATGAGAVQGSMDGAAGDPFTIAMTAPAAGVYSLPYLLGAAGGKLLSGKKGEAMSTGRGLSPVPDFGIDAMDPLRPIDRPAIISLLNRADKLSRTGRSY